MYTAATFQLSKALGLDFLLVIPRVLIWIALLTWLGAFVGLLGSLASGVALAIRRPRSTA
jgi:hypothetical protein